MYLTCHVLKKVYTLLVTAVASDGCAKATRSPLTGSLCNRLNAFFMLE